MDDVREASFLRDCQTMLIRSLKLSFRSPGTVALSLLAPASLLAVFVYVLGGAMDVGEVSVVNFIVPGVIVLTIGQSAPPIAVRINNDLTKGVMDRFRAMPIARASLLVGHVTATVLQSAVTAAVAVGVSLLVGFRPQAGFADWMMAGAVLMLYIVMMMWLAVWIGVATPNAEEASGYMTLIGVLPFLSSGFVPTETMPRVLRLFAENQPLTPIIDAVRALLLKQEIAAHTLPVAVLWCVGLSVVCCAAALHIYQRKTAT